MIKVSQSYIIYVYTHKATHSRAVSVAEPSQPSCQVPLFEGLTEFFVY